ncbi:MAG: Crp family transcriptional regulator [Firmicutes bacterium]|nr:Crp family transcriptional regulator [Bacillota bacterium]
MIEKTEIDVLKRSLDFWERLTPLQRKILTEDARAYSYEAGNALHFGEHDCIGVLIVISGTLRTYMLSEEGKEVTLYRLNKGDVCVLSASCVLDTITFDVHIDSETDCRIVQISSKAFSVLASENIYVEAFTHRLATERFSDVMWVMQQILFMSFDKRLAAFLIDESSKTGSNRIAMTHDQIARHMGSAREVVSRMLKYFSKEGWISLSRGNVEIIGKEQLRSLLSK